MKDLRNCVPPAVGIIVILCLASAQLVARELQPAIQGAQATTSSTTIPFAGQNNLIIIDARINGEGPFRMVLDTGSSAHVLNREIAERLGLRIIGPAVADSGNQTTPAEATEISELRIGELTFSNQRIFVTPLPASYPFDGLLGADLFKRFVVTIDFARAVVTLTPPAQFSKPDTGELVPLKLREGLIPEIKANVDGHTGWFKVDTGYNGYLALFAEFVAQHRSFADQNMYRQTKATGGLTIGGEVGKTPVIRINLLRFKTVSRVPRGRDGEILVSNVPAALFADKGGSNSAFAGAMGTLGLHKFRVTFDYSKRIMILE
jgi:predicted aspartyl protease